MSIDGTDWPIHEPSPLDPTFYSHKLNRSAYRYEVVVSIDGWDPVCFNGPFKAGSYTNLIIFRGDLKQHIIVNEFVVADRTYRDEKCIQKEMLSLAIDKKTHSQIVARQENVNEMLKNFKVLNTTFRHRRSLQGICFNSVAQILKLLIREEEPLRNVY